MLISKTMFKEYARCPRVSAMDDLYKQKMNSSISLFNDEKSGRMLEILGNMFNENGDDLIYQESNQTTALLEYYDNVEKYAMEFASQKFSIPIHYAIETAKQKRFSYIDEYNNEFYCFVDGYYEGEDEMYIFEVKATTATKFYNLGPKRKEATNSMKGLDYHNSIFEFNDENILVLKDKLSNELTAEKFQYYYEKLFDRYSEVGKYAFDIAIERNIIDNSLLQRNYNHSKKVNYYLVVLNSEYIFDGEYLNSTPVYNKDKNGNDLFIIIDMNKITFEYQEKIEKIKKTLISYIIDLDGSAVPLGRYCERKEESGCPFVNVCWREFSEKGSILEYINQHFGFVDEDGVRHQTIDLINRGLHRLDSIPVSWLTRPENLIQRNCYDNNIEYINKEKIKMGLDLIKYPIYYLDFESFPCPLPRYKGESPYSQSVFQFSVHTEQKRGICDIIEDNHYYLSLNHQDNREELIKSLIEVIDLSNGGTVVVYNKGFEYGRIKEFIEIFPQHKQELEKINAHMFDLLDLLKSNSRLYVKEFGMDSDEAKLINYYHVDLQGSFSIKKVLPLFSNLNYSDLAVSNGSEALATYASYHLYKQEDLQKIYEDLITYCRQDTWAMVLILHQLIKRTTEDISCK